MENQPLHYRERLRRHLASLSPIRRAVFAALCAERQYGTYSFVSNHDSRLCPEVIRKALDRCWAFISGTVIPMDELAETKNNIDGLIPNLEEDESSFASLILDATAAVSYLLNTCLTGNAEDAAYAGECSRNAVDEWIMGEYAPSSSTEDSHDRLVPISPDEVAACQSAVDAHPLMVEEMRAQAYALSYLADHETITLLDCKHLREVCANGKKSNIGLN